MGNLEICLGVKRDISPKAVKHVYVLKNSLQTVIQLRGDIVSFSVEVQNTYLDSTSNAEESTSFIIKFFQIFSVPVEIRGDQEV